MDPKVVYSELQAILAQKLSTVTYNGWFRDMKAAEIVEKDGRHVLMLHSQNELAQRIVPEKFTEIIQDAFELLNYTNFAFEVVFNDMPLDTNVVDNTDRRRQAGLIPSYTFDTFVEGEHNKLAYGTSLAVASFPGSTYNPLFIWGLSGLGKTHLLHAIGNHVIDENPEKSVLYVPTEKFMNEMIHSISTHTGDAFRKKYRNIDVLLIDDIQFIGKREGTQDEFFHTFNELYNNNKQIVICSDRPPEAIEQLAERIKSRFKWGMTAEINAPDFETRVAILQKKAELSQINIDAEVLTFIAENIVSNVRELEGALSRVDAYVKLMSPGASVTIEMAKIALKDFTGGGFKKAITSQAIISAVCDYYDLSIEDLQSKKRPANLVYPRHIAMYLCRKLTEDPLDAIGAALGGRDHTTIMNGVNRISDDLKDIHNEELPRVLSDIEKRLNGG